MNTNDDPLRRHSLQKRSNFTDRLQERGVSGPQYAAVTNYIYVRLFGTDANGLRKRFSIPLKGNIRDGLPAEDLAKVVITESRVATMLEDPTVKITEAIDRVAVFFVTMP